MRFTDLAQTLLQPLEATPKKLEQTVLLSQAFAAASPEDVPSITLFVLNQLGPKYANPELNMGLELFLLACARAASGASVTTSLFGEEQPDETTDRSAKQAMKRRFKELGDAGMLAQELGISGSGELTLQEVMDGLNAIALASGDGSQEDKVEQLKRLFQQLDPLSRRFVGRFVVGDTRLGVSDRTILDAVSWMLAGDKSLRERIEEVYQRHPDLPKLVLTAKQGGVEALEEIGAEVGVPVLPALCDRLKTTQEMIDKMGEVFVEPKYDGTRLQIHWNAQTGFLKTFTRNLEENTWMFPELPALLRELDVESSIFDAEAVGYDPDTHELVTFQQTIKRKRKHGIEAMSEAIPLRFFVFDVLYLNGVSLLREPLHARRGELEKILHAAQRDLVLAPNLRTTSAEELRTYHQLQLAEGLEGIIVKQINSPYQSGRKAFAWVKLKEAEGTTAKLSDTIDAVVLGYYFGRGKRTAFGVGAFLVGVLDKPGLDASKILTLAKIGTGLSDVQWRELKVRCDDLLAQTPSTEPSSEIQPVIPEGLMPDVMLPVAPIGLVVEVAADEVTRSPLHSAGVALRFPRLVRFRDDKDVSQATTVAEVMTIGKLE
jgi:DNA ligase-1